MPQFESGFEPFNTVISPATLCMKMKSAQGKPAHGNRIQIRSKNELIGDTEPANLSCLLVRAVDPLGSAFSLPPGSGSLFNMRIRIQEEKIFK